MKGGNGLRRRSVWAPARHRWKARCAHTRSCSPFIVPDTTIDEQFSDNALVLPEPHLRFHAGALLQTPERYPLGTISVLDYKPRHLDEKQKAFLRLMASQVMKLIEFRRINAAEHSARLLAEHLIKENETLTRESDHRV